LKGIATVGVVDGDKAQGVAQKLGVKGFPTFKLIVDGKITDYNGPRDANGMVNAVMSEVQSLVKGRLGGKASSKSSSSSGSKGGAGGGNNRKSDSEPGGGKHVLKGSAASFDDDVLNSNEPVLVECE
jgi:Thioredoxin